MLRIAICHLKKPTAIDLSIAHLEFLGHIEPERSRYDKENPWTVYLTSLTKEICEFALFSYLNN